MNDQNFVQFKKRRDLGTMLSDASKFFSVEWKPFLSTIFKTAIIPIFVAICAMIYYVMSFTKVLGGFAQSEDFNSVHNFNFSELIFPIVIFFFSYIVAYALMTLSSLSYIKSYIANKGVVNFNEVSSFTKEKFWPSIVLFLLNGLIVTFGALFCFFPAIYLGIALSVSICLLIFQNKSATDSINDSFRFIKGHWWETFGILLVVQIIIGVIGAIVGLPASLYHTTDLASIFQNQDPVDLIAAFKDPIYLLLLVFSYLANFVLYIITTIILVFIYYDIKEQKNPSLDIIDEIGVS